MTPSTTTTNAPSVDLFDEMRGTAERAVLGGVIAFPELLPEIRGHVSATDFSRLDCRQIFATLAAHEDEIRTPTDSLKILKAGGHLQGERRDFVASLIQSANANQAIAEAAMLARMGRLQSLQRLLQEALEDAANPLADPDELLERLADAKDDRRPTRLPIRSAAQLVSDHPTLRPAVIQGLLRRGETMNIIAGPKVGKSWLVLGLLVSVARGEDWLGFPTSKQNVLLLDNELHAETLSSRLKRVCDAVGCEIPPNIDTAVLRGAGHSIDDLARHLAGLADRYGIVVLDALYKFLPRGTNESENGDMTDVYNVVDAIASSSDASIVIVHHSSKGDQAGKAATDVGSGAGAIARAADTHLVLRAHEIDGMAVLDAHARSWPPMASQSIAFDWPLWSASLIAPELKQPKKRSSSRQKQPDNPFAHDFAMPTAADDPFYSEAR
jgi:hypothetical protein